MDHSDDDERFMPVVASVDRDIHFKVNGESFYIPNIAIEREDSQLRRLARGENGGTILPEGSFGTAVHVNADPRRFAAVAHYCLTDELDLDHYDIGELESVAVQYCIMSMRTLCDALIRSTKTTQRKPDVTDTFMDKQRPGPSGLAQMQHDARAKKPHKVLELIPARWGPGKTQPDWMKKKGLSKEALKDLEAADLPRLFMPPSEPHVKSPPEPTEQQQSLDADVALTAFKTSAWNALTRALRKAPQPQVLQRFPSPVVRQSRPDAVRGTIVLSKPRPWAMRAADQTEKRR